jgi:hypothetical protein
MKKSRFWKVKKEVDMLDPKTELEFQNFLKPLYKPKITSKSRIACHLLDAKHGERLSRSLDAFLDPNNPDFIYYLDKEKEEIAPGIVTKKKIYVTGQSRKLIQDNLPSVRAVYSLVWIELSPQDIDFANITRSQKPFIINDERSLKSSKNLRIMPPTSTKEFSLETKRLMTRLKRQGASILVHTKRTFQDIAPVIFYRVLLTFQIYINSSSEQKALVDENSRFYDIKKNLESLDEGTRKAFSKWMNEINIPWHDKKKRYVKAKLRDSDYGLLLLKLITNFLDKDNPDFLYYLNKKVEEVAIGEVKKKVVQHPIKNYTRDFLKEEMPWLKFYFMQFVLTGQAQAKNNANEQVKPKEEGNVK